MYFRFRSSSPQRRERKTESLREVDLQTLLPQRCGHCQRSFLSLSWSKLLFFALQAFQYSLYYLFFAFLFGCIYGILHWHFPDALLGSSSYQGTCELEHLLFSIETITTLGHSRVKPGNLWVQLLCSIEALLGLYFIVRFVSKAVSLTD